MLTNKKTILNTRHEKCGFAAAKVNQGKGRAGFTLIEMIVAITLFIIALTIGVTSLLSLSFANKQAQQTREVVDSISIVFEDIARTAREGENYTCDGADLNECQSIEIRSLINEESPGVPVRTEYSFDDSGDTVVKSTDGGETKVPLVSPDVTVNELTFRRYGGEKITGPERLLITLRGSVTGQDSKETSFNLQTSVVQRK